MGKKTHEQYVDEVIKRHDGKIKVLGTYVDSHTKILHKHVCGYEWLAAPYSVGNNGKGCLKCSGSMKKTHEEYLEEVWDKYHGNIEVLGLYVNRKTKILHRHKCGYERMVTPSDILAGKECPRCAGKNKTQSDYVNQVFEKHSGNITVLENYIDSRTKLLHKHICGYEWRSKPGDILSGYGCPKCAGTMKKTHDQYAAEILKMYGGEIEVLQNYENATTKILHRHKCGHEWLTRPNDILNGYCCPKCQTSKGETLLRKMLTDRRIQFEEQFTPNDCRYKRLLHFDFAVFKESKLTLLIEYDGMQHFKKTGFANAEKRFKDVQKRDSIKNKYCLEKGLKLLRIPYWKNENEIENLIDQTLSASN